MKRLSICLIISMIASIALNAQQVPIPDTHFLFALIEAGVDLDGNGTVEMKEAEAVKCLDISYKNIHDISGIGAFTSLTVLDCSRNYLTELDLSGIISLETLCCAVNFLESLDLSANPGIKELTCCYNRLTGLDLTHNKSLRFLDCSVNPLGSVDVSRNQVLEYLDCHDTQLGVLHLKHNPSLKYLICSFNHIDHLELTENRSLTHLECLCNGLRNLDVSNNRDLISLSCSFNQLTSLNISQNTRLEKLYCGYNQLKVLDISGNPNIRELDISGMKTLASLCVSAIPFPPEGMKVYSADSPHFIVKDCKPPQLDFCYIQNDPLVIEVRLSEDGAIYLVSELTTKDSTMISESCLCSAKMTAHVSRMIPVNSTMAGDYWLYAIDAAGNISNPMRIDPQWTGIAKDPGDRVLIYPNPSRGWLNIVSRFPGRTDIRITDMNTVIVKETIMEGGTLQLDIALLPPGVFLVEVKSVQDVTVRKIIKF